jgi:hypothetical protein
MMFVMNTQRLAIAVVGIIASFIGAELSAAAAQNEYSVGVAAVDITPDYPIRLNGFGFRRTESEGVTQRIWAKALAIGTDAEKPLVLLTVDSLGIRLPMVEEVARRLKEKAGIERSRLAVCFSHSHTTPKVNGASDTIFGMPVAAAEQERIDRYTAELTDALERAALAALADREPATLEWAVGNVGFAKNRRMEGGPVDHRLPMLVVKSPEDAKIRAIYVTYACHCVTLSLNQISGDWAGYAQAAIERDHPGAVALVSIGCGSDSNPSSGVTGDKVAVAAEQGDEIAGEVARLLKGPLKQVSGPVSATYATIDLPLNKAPSREELEAAASGGDAAAYNAKFQLAKLERGESLQDKIVYPIEAWSFGDSLSMVFLGGEICVDYSLRLQKELDPSRVWLHGYSNDFGCYVPSERLLKEGGYGGGGEIVYFALPATLQTGIEEKIIAEVRRQVPADFHGVENAPDGETKADAATAVMKLVDGLAVGTPAEYERIPEIWRHAIDAGKRNDAEELRRLLAVSVPEMDQPATHWQVVVVGGGIINGLSQVGVRPGERVRDLLESDAALMKRWERLIDLSTTMADDTAVPSGTRYDSLRILGADDFARHGKQLVKYLESDNGELQMGAVSGLSDMQATEAAEALVAAFGKYNEGNRKLSIEALLRTRERRELLKAAIKQGKIDANAISAEQKASLDSN